MSSTTQLISVMENAMVLIVETLQHLDLQKKAIDKNSVTKELTNLTILIQVFQNKNLISKKLETLRYLDSKNIELTCEELGELNILVRKTLRDLSCLDSNKLVKTNNSDLTRLKSSLNCASEPTTSYMEPLKLRRCKSMDSLNLLVEECSSLSSKENEFPDVEYISKKEGLIIIDVTLKKTRKIENGLNSYTLYECVAKSNSTTIIVEKRYSEFVNLRKELCSMFPQYKKNIPKLPRKKMVGKFKKSFVEHRRHHLEYFVTYIALHPIIGTSTAIQLWFGII